MTIRVRVTTCLDVAKGRLVKGVIADRALFKERLDLAATIAMASRI